MKYTKTYDNFITNLFTKRKKLPIEMQKLQMALSHIVEYYINDIDKKWSVESVEHESTNKKYHNAFSIYIDPNDGYKGTQTNAKIIGLYYKEELEQIMLVFIEVSKSVINLEEFINNIFKPFEAQKNNNHVNNDYYFFIPLDKVQSVINEMTIENLKEFLTEKKYNL